MSMFTSALDLSFFICDSCGSVSAIPKDDAVDNTKLPIGWSSVSITTEGIKSRLGTGYILDPKVETKLLCSKCSKR